jgi:hypothetical protein
MSIGILLEFDGKTWHTAAATSPDGIAWTKLGRVLAYRLEGDYIAANGSALVVGDEICTGIRRHAAACRARSLEGRPRGRAKEKPCCLSARVAVR